MKKFCFHLQRLGSLTPEDKSEKKFLKIEANVLNSINPVYLKIDNSWMTENLHKQMNTYYE